MIQMYVVTQNAIGQWLAYVADPMRPSCIGIDFDGYFADTPEEALAKLTAAHQLTGRQRG